MKKETAKYFRTILKKNGVTMTYSPEDDAIRIETANLIYSSISMKRNEAKQMIAMLQELLDEVEATDD